MFVTILVHIQTSTGILWLNPGLLNALKDTWITLL